MEIIKKNQLIILFPLFVISFFSCSLINQNKFTKNDLGKSWSFLKIFDSIFGLLRKTEIELPDSIKSILDSRKQARDNKNWQLADDLRISLKKMGWVVEDTPNGQRVRELN